MDKEEEQRIKEILSNLDLEIINNDLTVHDAHIDINGYRIDLHTSYNTLASGECRYVVITDKLFENKMCIISGQSASKGEAKMPTVASNSIATIYMEADDPILTEDKITIMRDIPLGTPLYLRRLSEFLNDQLVELRQWIGDGMNWNDHIDYMIEILEKSRMEGDIK